MADLGKTLTEKYVLLLDEERAYKKTRKINYEKVQKILDCKSKVQIENRPLRARPLPYVELILRNSLKTLVKFDGFEDITSDAENLLLSAITRKFEEISLQYRYAKQRRRDDYQSAFSSSIQQVFCLHGIQNTLGIKNYYDKQLLERYRILEEKWNGLLKSKKGRQRDSDDQEQPAKRSR